MPKKVIRNSFYFYMQDFREQQKKLGITYPSMKEVADAAGPAWRDENPSVRAKYDAMAKAEKAKNNVAEKKFTSTGQSLADIERIERERKELEQAEQQDILDFVTQKSISGDLLDEDMFLMDINYYCKTGDGVYLVGEMALLRFSLRDGIRDTYHELINPGPPPVGYAYDVKLGCEELALPPPGGGASSAAQLLAHLVDYLRPRPAPAPDAEPLPLRRQAPPPPPPPVYTLPDKVPAILDFIQQLCIKAAEDECMFRVYKLDGLLYQLLRAVGGEGLPRASLATTLLRRDAFLYTPSLGCDHHESGDRPQQCALSRVKRWAYTVLDAACARDGIAPIAGRHVPHDYDMDSILSYREAHAPARAAPPPSLDSSRDLTSHSLASAANTSATAANLSTATTASGTSTNTDDTRKKRVHVPLRKPNVDYASQLRQAPPSLFNRDDEFPSLVTKGRGRGMSSLSSSFDSMKM